MSVGSKVNYYGYDGRGNVSELMNAIGGVNISYSYGAFGKTSTKVTTYTKNSYTYNGENVDLIPGVPDLQYLRARYYDPNMGRFMQQDTLFGEMERPLTQNLYIYCLNNGVNLRDPSGNSSVAELQAQYDRAQRAGAGQSVLDGIKSAMESKRKAESKPTPKPTTKPPKPKPPTKPTPPKSDGGSLTPQDISELLDEGSIIGGCLDEFERAGNLDDNQKQIYEALKKRQDEIFKLMEGFVKANPNLSEKDWNKIYFPATQMTDAELLDKLQTAFDVAGVIPILGEGFDFTNGIISALRGDWAMAGLSIGSMIPIAGDIVGKGGKAAIKYGDNVVDAIKGQGRRIIFGSDAKSAERLASQIRQRGWSDTLIRGVVDSPYTTRKSVNKATKNPATAYYSSNGSYVIIDDFTGEIVQVSDNINPKDWIPDSGIIDPFLK